MASDNNLKIDALDFQGIKTNFKSYLQAQDQFRDYNFEGSGLNVLLDLLAYNTYYNSFYLNMVAAEAFLPTAQKRNSVVNLAKSLNYTPRSVTSASISGTATLTVTGAPANVTIPAYTSFTGSVDGTTYNFLNTSSVIVTPSGGVYSSAMSLKEGRYINRRYTVNLNDPDQRFLIPNKNVDTSTLTVSVLNSSSDSTVRTFSKVTSLVEVASTTRVYYIEEVEDGQYEIKFGDDVFGVALDAGNIVVLEYLVSNGTSANDIETLTYADAIAGVTTINFVSADPATGGADRESINQIKFNAPKAYEAQNRVVTADDYKTLMLQQATVDSCVVWGGEDNDPPTYGKVFIAVKPKVGDVLTATEKLNLINSVINPKKILTITTEIVDPEYTYIIIEATVKYQSDATILSAAEIKQLVINTIKTYNTDEINQFSKYFRYSKLSRLIDTTERSVLSNVMSARMRKEVDVQLGVGTRYEISFSNAIDNATNGRPTTSAYGVGNKITSNAFTFGGYANCFLEDNNGLIRIYRVLGLENIAVSINAGTINYTTGKIVLTNFAPTAFNDGSTTLKITAVPQDKDILPLRSQIISIRDADISVTMVDDKSISLVNR
jgi:hypothetical protein